MTRTRTLLMMCALGILVSTACLPPAVWAWSCIGHEVVALIAKRQLTPHARIQVDLLLRNHPIGETLQRFCNSRGLGRFADGSTWADDVREVPDFAHTGSWHFINIPIGNSPERVTGFCPPSGCIVTAIGDQIALLRNARVGSDEQAAALRFLTHFVGDIHQPLHCATNNDRGGNCVPVQFLGRASTLHSIWDAELVYEATHGASLNAFVDRLAVQFASQMHLWGSGGIDPEQWAKDSHVLAERLAYGRLPKRVAVDSTLTTPSGSCSLPDLPPQSINQTYEDAALPVIEEQLATAGTRLAVILNEIWP